MRSKYFSKKEIECSCGCNTDNASEILMNKADKVREILGRPLIATSVVRCKKYNNSKGYSSTSSHIADEVKECEAIDFKATTSRERFEIVSAMVEVGFTRIGIAKTFVHGDVDKSKVQDLIWLY